MDTEMDTATDVVMDMESDREKTTEMDMDMDDEISGGERTRRCSGLHTAEPLGQRHVLNVLWVG